MNRNILVILAGRDAGLSRTLGASSGAVDGFTRKVDQANSRSQKMAAATKLAFQALAVAAVFALGAAIAAAVRFESEMANVETVAHAGEQGIKTMSNAVLEMATKLPQSTSTLTAGLYDIASSGFYGADALKLLEVSATAASAGLTDTAVASKAIVAVLNAYGLTARDAADVSDILFQTVELGVLSFQDLATQIGDVIGAAAAADIEFEEIGAAMATMTLAGLSAAESATSLNRLIQKLIKPSSGLAEALRKMGYESGKAALDQLGLHGTMEMIRKATGGQITELMKLFPEIRAARGAYALMAADGMNYARVQDIITNEQDRAGATQRAFNIQMGAVGNQFKLLTNSVQVFGIRVGTNFLPVVADAISLAREFGGTLGDGFKTLARLAGPTIDQLGRTINELADFFHVLGETASPVLRGLATFTAAVTIGTLHAIMKVVEELAAFLIDHPGLVRALAIAYGGILVGNLLAATSAFLKLQGGLMAVRLGLAGLTAQAVISNVVARLSALAFAIQGLATGMPVMVHLGAAFSGLATAMSNPALAGIAIIGGLYAIQTGFDKARKEAEKMVTAIKDGFDLKTLEGMKGAISELNVAVGKNNEEWDKMGSNDVVKTLKGTLELLTPMENKVIDNSAAFKEMNAEIDDLQTTVNMWEHDLNTLSNTLGLSKNEVQAFLDELEYDPSKNRLTTGELADQIRQLKASAESGTPATDAYVSALEAVADPAASATDQVKALDDAIKGLIGTAMELVDAEIGWEAAVDDLTQAVKDNGTTLDITTEKGREVASSINDAAKAAIDHANAVAAQTGNIEDGVGVLNLHRQALHDQMIQLGFTEEEANNYLTTLGLTPDNISTLVELQNSQSAMLQLEEFQYLLGLINTAETKPTVDIDTAQFDEDYLKIAQALIQINMANPEAEVLLNGEKFEPTAEMVTAWAMAWDASTPEAEALLSIIDPNDKFATLQEAAENWDTASPQADARLDSARANAEFHSIESRARAWNAQSPTAKANLYDNATGKINNIVANLARIRDKTVTVTVLEKNFNAGGGIVVRRLGGIDHARGGLLREAGVAHRPAIMFGELATGGEAFIPKNGNPNRSKSILAQAAAWYGMEVRPRGSGGDGGSINDFRTSVSVTINAKNISDPKSLVRQVRDVVASELDEHDRKLRRELASR